MKNAATRQCAFLSFVQRSKFNTKQVIFAGIFEYIHARTVFCPFLALEYPSKTKRCKKHC